MDVRETPINGHRPALERRINDATLYSIVKSRTKQPVLVKQGKQIRAEFKTRYWDEVLNSGHFALSTLYDVKRLNDDGTTTLVWQQPAMSPTVPPAETVSGLSDNPLAGFQYGASMSNIQNKQLADIVRTTTESAHEALSDELRAKDDMISTLNDRLDQFLERNTSREAEFAAERKIYQDEIFQLKSELAALKKEREIEERFSKMQEDFEKKLEREYAKENDGGGMSDLVSIMSMFAPMLGKGPQAGATPLAGGPPPPRPAQPAQQPQGRPQQRPQPQPMNNVQYEEPEYTDG